MSNISNIDDLLMGIGNSQQPATPEHKDKVQQEQQQDNKTESDDSNVEVEYESDPMSEQEDQTIDDETTEEKSDTSASNEEEKEEADDIDEYGNKKERMSKGMKDRLDRKEKQHQREIEQRDREVEELRQRLAQQGASPQLQKATADFQYNPDNEASWQQQLTDFVRQTVTVMNTEQQQQQQLQQRQLQEQQAEREFKQKFTKGMEKFPDFVDVVGSQPIDEAMTLALRAINDPSAFIYAASKRQPEELERISKLKDPYARMVEMGRLEERMRRNKPITQAPRPLGRTREDAVVKPTPKQKDTTGDDLLAKADAKRLSTVKARHKSNR